MPKHLKSHLELLHSRPINLHKACYNKQMSLFCDNIFSVYFSHKKNIKKNIAKRHLQKILIDIYHAWYFDPTLCLSVSFNNNDYTLPARYNKLKITKKTIGIIKDLVASGLLYYKAGMPPKNQFRSGPSYISRIWPTERLIRYFLDIKFNIFNISAHDIDKESIILCKKTHLLKEVKKPGIRDKFRHKPITYSDTSKTREMRLVLACYNLLLRKSHIDINTAENNHVTTTNDWGNKTTCFIEPNCFIHRTFINSTFNDGGRIYGGWWQDCPYTERKNIFIDGSPVVEVAYSGAYLGILYQIEGLSPHDIVTDGDLYDVIIPEFDNISERELVNYSRSDLMKFKKFLIKTLTNNGITAASKNALWITTIRAITAEQYLINGEIRRPPFKILKTISHKFLASVFDRIKQKHQPIAHYFLAGIASKLQKIVSNMTMNIIEHFTALKVPVLTLHDSYIIEQKWGKTLINTMQCSWIQEMTDLQTAQKDVSTNNKHLERITRHENNYETRHLLAQPNKITADNAVSDGILTGFNLFLKRSDKINMRELYDNQWSDWCENVIETKPLADKTYCTDRYLRSLKLHRDWLVEGDTEDNSPEIKSRYDSFYADINNVLYGEWLRYKPLWKQSDQNS